MSDAKRLQAIYDREVIFEITAFFDTGIQVVCGDYVNGWEHGGTFDTFEEAITWLEEKTKETK